MYDYTRLAKCPRGPAVPRLWYMHQILVGFAQDSLRELTAFSGFQLYLGSYL